MKHLGISISALLALFALPAFVFAQTVLVNINTADAATLDTLPGIGPTKAQAIIDFRDANGSFATVEDIQEVSGIGPSTFAEIEPFITVGNDATDAAQDVSNTASSTPPVPVATGASTYVPPPSGLSVKVSMSPSSALMEVPLSFVAAVKTKSGSADSSAHITWSFGDGSSGEGSTVEKTYHYAGDYLIVATASDGATSARGELEVVVEPSTVRIAAVSGEGVLLVNDGDSRLDLSRWRLTSSEGIFRIPQGTAILPHTSVLFPFAVMNLPVALDAALTYPDGIIAATYPPPAITVADAASPTVVLADTMQPSSVPDGSQGTRTVDPLTSQEASVQLHAEPVIAPTAAPNDATVGAVVAQEPTTAARKATTASSSPAAAPSPLFHSPWTFGLAGVAAAAAGFFIFL